MKIMYTPLKPIFTIRKWDVRGYTLHGHKKTNVLHMQKQRRRSDAADQRIVFAT